MIPEYSYTESQVRVFAEGNGTLSPSTVKALEVHDELLNDLYEIQSILLGEEI